MVLPLIIAAALSWVAVAFIGVATASAIGIWLNWFVAMLSPIIWGAVFLLVAWKMPDISLFRGERTEITLKTIITMIGLAFIIIPLLGMTFQNVLGSMMTAPQLAAFETCEAQAGADCTAPIAPEVAGQQLQTTSIASLATVIAVVIIGAIVVDKVAFKGKLMKRKKKRR